MALMLGGKISCVRGFGRFKQTYSDGLVVNFNLRQPLAVFTAHARKSAFVLSRFLVLCVFGVCYFAQIMQRIIGAVSVYVVNLLRGPSPMHMQPRQSVRQIQPVIHSYNNVPVTHYAPCNAVFTAFAAANSPCKDAVFWVVVKQLFKSLCGKFHNQPFFAHCKVNINVAVPGGQV